MLTKHELATIGDGGTLGTGTVFMYRVYGIHAEEAFLYNPSPREAHWQYRRFNGPDPLGGWNGDFRTADDALAALETEIKQKK